MSRLNPASWILWSGCAAGAGLLTRNPWYLLGLAGIALLVGWRRSRRPPGRTALILAAGIVVSSTVLNLFFSRAGDTVLIHLPMGWFGGPYTLEGLAFGVSAGLQVATVLLVMGVFSQAVTAADLLRRTPRGLYPVGVAATLGLTFAPHARRSLTDLREARALRGLPPPSWREAPYLLAPMVVMSLERAIGQAEALAVRGWSRQSASARGRSGLAWAAIGAAVLLCAASPERAGLAILLLVLAVAAHWISVARRDQAFRTPVDRWSGRDTVVTSLALGSLLSLLAMESLSPGSLGYYPYPVAIWPSLAGAPLAAISLLAAPALAGSS